MWSLAGGERDVTALAEQSGVSVQVVSQHFAKMRLAGWVQSRREGRHQVYLVSDPYLAKVVQDMVEHYANRPSHAGNTVPSSAAPLTTAGLG